MIRINLVRGKRKKRRELDVGSAWLALPLVVLAGTIYFHTTVSGKLSRLDADIGKANADIARLKEGPKAKGWSEHEAALLQVAEVRQRGRDLGVELGEVHAREVQCLELRERGPVFVSCPTCGRCSVAMIPIAERVEQRLSRLKGEVNVAVMGCEVNGPGEARAADIGFAGGKDEGLLFRNGEPIGKVPALVDGDTVEIKRKVQEANRTGQTAVLRRNAPFAVMAAVEELRADLPGLDVQVVPLRNYPEGGAAAQDGVGFPNHPKRGVEVVEELQHGHIDPAGREGVVAEVNGVDEEQQEVGQGEIPGPSPPRGAAPCGDGIPPFGNRGKMGMCRER